ncbi:lactate utilization protein C [Aciduricibacillus chroicocephali]|uniref:Lactate utilization protein C n=1 Tax=Aciduricibacillus chroicocephali TaxID=3054939 RepID=A0ABY9KVH7_9BACI|nr:lactate utilization protein C [Bacillaceae bacterium 44XB]
MAIQNRDVFLERLAGRLGRGPRTVGVERPEWTVRPQHKVLVDASQDELVDVLKRQCKVIHTDFRKTNIESLAQTLDEVIKNYSGNKIIIANDQRTADAELDFYFDRKRADGCLVHVWDEEIGKENQQRAEQADIGITFSDMTLAESGTIALFNDKNQSRSISLLPHSYIAIIPKSTIVPRFTQAAQQVRKRLAAGEKVGSCVSLVTGPSNSADIEMHLIVGVHGPVEATYIVVEDM